jgi:hypothetical protein
MFIMCGTPSSSSDEHGWRRGSSLSQVITMARLVAGEVRMRVNDADGWILMCQSEPVTDSVTVEYE